MGFEIVIGILLLSTGIGLFIWMANSRQDNSVKRMIASLKKKQQQKREEKELRNEIKVKARLKALREMEDDIVEKMKEEEKKKITGEHRKEKMQKFANAFSMNGSGNGVSQNNSEKIEKMLGMVDDTSKNDGLLEKEEEKNKIFDMLKK